MSTKKTLYELLELPTDASAVDIKVAHERLSEKLETQRMHLGADEYTVKARLLRVAYSTLNSPVSRASYDMQLTLGSGANTAPARPMTKGGGLQLVPMTIDAKADMRSDALLMRAEAMSLRADALMMKADGASPYAGVNARSNGRSSAVALLPTFGGGEEVIKTAKSATKSIVFSVGVVVVLGFVMKLVFAMVVGRSGGNPDSPAQRAAADKMFFQEYFQTHGVRPSSRAEAAQWDADRRNEQIANNRAETAEREKRRAEENLRRQYEDAQRQGRQISRALADEQSLEKWAAENEKRENAEQKRQKEERDRQDAREQRWREEQQRQQWRDVIRR